MLLVCLQSKHIVTTTDNSPTFLLLACDGTWDVVTDDQATQIIQSYYWETIEKLQSTTTSNNNQLKQILQEGVACWLIQEAIKLYSCYLRSSSLLNERNVWWWRITVIFSRWLWFMIIIVFTLCNFWGYDIMIWMDDCCSRLYNHTMFYNIMFRDNSILALYNCNLTTRVG